MARIGIDTRITHYRVGGITTYIRNLIPALEKLESVHDFTLIQSRHKKHAMGSSLKQFNTARVFTPPHHRLERWTLSLELIRHRLKLLHNPDFIPPQWGAKYHVITIHDLTFLHYPEHKDAEGSRYYTEQIQFAVKHADHILSVSQATKLDLIDMLNVPEEKITVQPNGVSFRQLATLKETSLGERLFTHWLHDEDFPKDYLLHVGTLEPRKNIPTLLEAYMELRKRLDHPPALLLVGHPGWLFDQTMKKIERLQSAGVPIIVRSDVTNNELPLIYTGAKALVMPSYYEGFGLPALEAMACGTPVIASSNSAFPEVVGDAGLLIDPYDPDDLANAMEKALTDDEWRNLMKEKGPIQASKFTWENSARIALSVYNQLLA